MPSQRLGDLANSLWTVYGAAFGTSPVAVERFRDDSLVRHAGYRGFRCDVALSDTGSPLGFVYGYHCEPGRWWADQVAGRLRELGAGA